MRCAGSYESSTSSAGGEKGAFVLLFHAFSHDLCAFPSAVPIASSLHYPCTSLLLFSSPVFSGAGDCFVGSLGFFLGCGVSLLESIRKANQVAAVKVGRQGTQSGFPDREALQKSKVLADIKLTL